MRAWASLLALITPLAALAADRTPAPLDAQTAAKRSVLPDGFKMTVFAAEPDVVQPISFCTDARGRLWVAEALNYGEWKAAGKDRVVILEEKGGKLKRTVFYEGFNYITGIEVGFGGVWVMSPPCLYFVPDRDADDKPDGPPEVLFDGFGYKESRHNLANGFTWGPDGWLYGGHGRTSPSDVGRPGAPADRRVHCDGGVYRIHPTRLVFENFADGTTNPWGVDFDDYGACFVSNCVNPHLFHVVQGGHFEPWRNRPSSLYAYERLPTIADHLHYPGGNWQQARGETPETLAMGGGHAHCGTLVYLGDTFPREYRNTVFMCNVHGRRVNNDVLRPKGSGYTASHGNDFMTSADPWFMGVTLRTGPDGSVFVSDWSDTGECHTLKPDKSTGRIYKISYVGTAGGGGRKAEHDLAKLPSAELVKLQGHANDWYVRHARRVLQERAAQKGWKGEEVWEELCEVLENETSVPKRLRALWALHATGGANVEVLEHLLQDKRPHMQAWAVQLLCESGSPSAGTLREFADLAKHEPAPVVRLALAAALQRVPVEKRWAIAEQLVRNAPDATDANLPLMIWYGIEPCVPAEPARALALALKCEIPLVRQFVARRAVDAAAAKGAQGDLAPLVAALTLADVNVARDLLTGAREALRGRKNVKLPDGWAAAYSRVNAHADPDVRELARALALTFGDPQALADLRKLVSDTSAPVAGRVRAVEALAESRAADLAPLLHDQLGDKGTRRAALRALASYAHPDTPKKVLAAYAGLAADERADAVATLAARKEYALALLDAVEGKTVPRGDVSAFAARQMFALNDAKVTERLKAVWGEVRATTADRQKQLVRYKSQLTPAALKAADLSNGRAVFAKSCQSCHKLFGEGGTTGPDLTGS
ncbi:MAG: PVC-type heme-binding CxxCH protein, partial [Gemmata sp.]